MVVEAASWWSRTRACCCCCVAAVSRSPKLPKPRRHASKNRDLRRIRSHKVLPAKQQPAEELVLASDLSMEVPFTIARCSSEELGSGARLLQASGHPSGQHDAGWAWTTAVRAASG